MSQNIVIPNSINSIKYFFFTQTNYRYASYKTYKITLMPFNMKKRNILFILYIGCGLCVPYSIQQASITINGYVHF